MACGDFSVKFKRLLTGRKKQSFLLKQDITGDCLDIKLEGDLQSWINMLKKFSFGMKFFRIRFSKFLSVPGRILNFVHSKSHSRISVDSKSQFFHCLSLDHSNGVLCPLWGVKRAKGRFVSSPGSSFNCCTTVGKNLCVGHPLLPKITTPSPPPPPPPPPITITKSVPWKL